MRAVRLFPVLLLAGCAAAPSGHPAASCTAQGHAPGSEAFRACLDAGGAQIATGPGSPFMNADEDEGL